MNRREGAEVMNTVSLANAAGKRRKAAVVLEKEGSQRPVA